MSRRSDYVKEPSRPLVFNVPQKTADYMKYIAAWEKKTMTEVLTARINEFIQEWKELNPAKADLWRQQYEDCRD